MLSWQNLFAISQTSTEIRHAAENINDTRSSNLQRITINCFKTMELFDSFTLSFYIFWPALYMSKYMYNEISS